jgi:hypothetical protein
VLIVFGGITPIYVLSRILIPVRLKEWGYDFGIYDLLI